MGQLLTHIVCKSFGDDTIDRHDALRKRLAGEVVNALMWRNVEGLEKGRHIVALPEGLEPISDSRGRFWMDLTSLQIAEREPFVAEIKKTTKGPRSISRVTVTEDQPWFMKVDLDDPKTNYESGFNKYAKAPKKVSERRWQLFDGTVVLGKAVAFLQHSAGVRALIEKLRAEHTASTAGGTP